MVGRAVGAVGWGFASGSDLEFFGIASPQFVHSLPSTLRRRQEKWMECDIGTKDADSRPEPPWASHVRLSWTSGWLVPAHP